MNKNEFLSLLPKVVSGNERLNALASATAEVLSHQYESIVLDDIYGKIDDLPERLLDILAKDFRIEWWSQEMSVEDKRETLKSSWFVHRKLGTKGAVKRALSSVYAESDVSEWYEYGGVPYHFKIMIDAEYEGTDLDKYNAIIQNVKFYKNVRSYLDAVEYYSLGVKVKQYVGAFTSAASFRDSCTTAN